MNITSVYITEDRSNTWRVTSSTISRTVEVSHGAYSKHNTWKRAYRNSKGELMCKQCGRISPKWLMTYAWSLGINTMEYKLLDKPIYPDKAFEDA